MAASATYSLADEAAGIAVTVEVELLEIDCSAPGPRTNATVSRSIAWAIPVTTATR